MKAIFIARSSTLFFSFELKGDSARTSSSAVGPSMRSRLLDIDVEVRAWSRCFHHFVEVISLEATSGSAIADDGTCWSEMPALERCATASL